MPIIWILLFSLFSAALVAAILFFRHQKSVAQKALNSLHELNRELERQVSEKNDLTQRLIGSEERYKRGIEEVGAAIWEWDLVEDTIHVSGLVLKTTGYQENEIGTEPKFFKDLIHQDDFPTLSEGLEQLKKGSKDEVNLEIRHKFKDGKFHWVYSRVTSILDDSGQPCRLVGSFSDISARISAEEERDRLFNLSIDMMAVLGFDNILQQINPAWVRILGWSRDELMGRPLFFFIHPDDQEFSREAFASLHSGQPLEELDMRFRRRNGSYLWLSWSSFPYPDRQVVFSVVKDITHNKMAEQKLLDYQDRLRSLSSQLALVEDRERKELASAIHDGLAQQLFGIRAKVTLMKYPEKLDDLSLLVTETIEIIDDTMNQARSLSFELFPPVLHEVGLDAAINWLAHSYAERTGIECVVSIEGEGPELSIDIRTMAYQSVRELLANVRKHSGAEHCSIILNHVDDFLTILVEDLGHGFDMNASRGGNGSHNKSGGFGLFSIRERMRSVHGRMLVDSSIDNGCRVFLTFPIDSFVQPQLPDSLENSEH
ncbi:MAG: PAS domain S-box protein [bacterium]|nr:PAS domain S-box protein [bacterium]